MSCNKNEDSNNCNLCGCLGIFLSILFGALIGILFAYGFIPIARIILWAIFGLATIVLGFTLIYPISAGFTKCSTLIKCLGKSSSCLLGGTIGTIVSTIVALSATLVVGSTFSIIVVSLLAFFCALMVIGVVGFVKCIQTENC